jgi:hypothetical protein
MPFKIGAEIPPRLPVEVSTGETKSYQNGKKIQPEV